MKLINKIFCLFFVLAICLPVMCFPVSADDQDTGFNDSVLASLPNFDTTDFSAYDLTFLENTLQSLLSGSGKIEKLREDSAYLPFEGSINGNSYLGVSKRCEQTVFLYGLINALQSGLIDVNLPVYYYLHYFTYFDSNNNTFYCYNYLFSNNVFEFVNYDSTHNTIKFNKTLHKDVSLRYPLLSNISVGYTKTSGNQTSYIYSKSDFTYCGLNNIKSYSGYKSESLFCNFDIKGLDLFNTDIVAVNGFESVKPKDFKTQIDVKLTPEFTLDMDRVFDKNTGQNDYFKLEVTNNSDTNVQFCASITEKKSEDFLKPIGGNIIDNIFKIDYEDWEDAYWNYIGDTQYYADCYKKTDKYLGIKHEYTRYAELRKGNFYWVLLKPGEKFEDFIYWENVKIKADEEYSFIVDCLPTGLDYPTDVFYSMSLNTKIFPFPEELESVRNDYYRDDTLEHYSLNFEECVRACNYVFSVESIPNFTTTVKGGNSKITSGWKDTVSQSTNPYYREDTRTGEIIPVGNYQEFNGNLPDVDIDIDNLSVDNVKDYIRYSQNFFTLVKSVFTFAPGLWLLIVFGLTAIIIIAIVRYIRG